MIVLRPLRVPPQTWRCGENLPWVLLRPLPSLRIPGPTQRRPHIGVATPAHMFKLLSSSPGTAAPRHPSGRGAYPTVRPPSGGQTQGSHLGGELWCPRYPDHCLHWGLVSNGHISLATQAPQPMKRAIARGGTAQGGASCPGLRMV